MFNWLRFWNFRISLFIVFLVGSTAYTLVVCLYTEWTETTLLTSSLAWFTITVGIFYECLRFAYNQSKEKIKIEIKNFNVETNASEFEPSLFNNLEFPKNIRIHLETLEGPSLDEYLSQWNKIDSSRPGDIRTVIISNNDSNTYAVFYEEKTILLFPKEDITLIMRAGYKRTFKKYRFKVRKLVPMGFSRRHYGF